MKNSPYLDRPPIPAPKTPGQRAYETELLARPNYDSGKPRKKWNDLSAWVQSTWEHNPIPRWTVDQTEGV